MSIKTKLIGGVSALALAGGLIAVAAPAANPAVTTIGTCQNLLAEGTAKSSTINPATGKAYDIADVDNIDGSIGAKGVDPNTLKGTNLGTCSFPSNATNGVPNANKPVGTWGSGTKSVIKWSTKLYSVRVRLQHAGRRCRPAARGQDGVVAERRGLEHLVQRAHHGGQAGQHPGGHHGRRLHRPRQQPRPSPAGRRRVPRPREQGCGARC